MYEHIIVSIFLKVFWTDLFLKASSTRRFIFPKAFLLEDMRLSGTSYERFGDTNHSKSQVLPHEIVQFQHFFFKVIESLCSQHRA
jgi:hypothetical protein